MPDPGVSTLQRALFDFRTERRKIQNRIDELEEELEQTRRQRDQYDLLIEKNEEALQDALALPGTTPRKTEPVPPQRAYQPQVRREPERHLRYSEIEEAIEEAERSDRGSNVRFADFRIPE